MDYIAVNQLFTAVVDIPESQSTDTVTYKVYKASDNSIFAQGSASYLAGVNWKIQFTPTTLNEVYVVEVKDETLDVIYTQSFQAFSSSALSDSVEDEEAPTTSELIVLIDKAIATRLRGGAVQSYSIGGRNLQYMTLSELKNLRSDLLNQSAAQKGGGRNYVKFVNPD